MEISRCHICGEIKSMTFEHIPPKLSGNSTPNIGLASLCEEENGVIRIN